MSITQPTVDDARANVPWWVECCGAKVEDLRQIYLEHSRARKKIDLVSFRKLMCYFGVTSKEVIDRVFEIHDIARGKYTAWWTSQQLSVFCHSEKSLKFEDFLRIMVLFKQGEKIEQAASNP